MQDIATTKNNKHACIIKESSINVNKGIMIPFCVQLKKMHT